MTSKNDKYQGRQTSRKSSAERRLKILEATMRIIVRDGIRGVRHRAVAAEAEVPLAATTYYFEHINDLISDAFVLFYERQRDRNRELGEASYQHIIRFSHEQISQTEVRAQLSDDLAELITGHIESLVTNPDEAMLEYAFYNEAMHNPILRELVDSSFKERHWQIEKCLREIDSSHSAVDAKAILAVINHMEYVSTLGGISEFNRPMVYNTVRRAVRLILNCEEVELA